MIDYKNPTTKRLRDFLRLISGIHIGKILFVGAEEYFVFDFITR